MKSGGFFFVVFAVLYIGFELYAVEKTRYRMEPEFMYLDHVRAAHAAHVCNKDISEWQIRFEQNAEYAKQRAIIAADAGDEKDSAVLADRASAATKDVDDLIAAQGCEHTEVWRLLRRYELLANQNPPIRR